MIPVRRNMRLRTAKACRKRYQRQVLGLLLLSCRSAAGTSALAVQAVAYRHNTEPWITSLHQWVDAPPCVHL